MKARFYLCSCPSTNFRGIHRGVWLPIHVGKQHIMRCGRCGQCWAVEDEQNYQLPISHFQGDRNKIKI